MAKYKAILLDVGGIVLRIDWNRPFEFASVFDSRRRQEMIESFEGWKHFHLYEKGLISSAEFLAEFNAFFRMQRTPGFWQQAWESILIGPLPDVEMIFDEFLGKIPLCAVSNTNAIHYEFFMKCFPVFRRFDRIFTSFELHERKPDAAFYLKVAKELDCEPNEVLFVDDTLANVEAARRTGFRATQTINSTRDTLDFLSANLEAK